MGGFQTIFLVIMLPALAMGLHELTHLTVARIAGPFSIERVSWVPFRLRLNFDRIPSKGIFRMIAAAPLIVGGIIAVIGVQIGTWQQIKTADPYYLHHLTIGYWLLYIILSPADIRLAIWPPTEDTHSHQMNSQ